MIGNISRKTKSVIKVLRREVPKPSELPNSIWPEQKEEYRRLLRWQVPSDPLNDGYGGTGPLGLHKKSWLPLPTRSEEFAGGVCSTRQIVSFLSWWDSINQTQRQAGVDAIWDEERFSLREVPRKVKTYLRNMWYEYRRKRYMRRYVFIGKDLHTTTDRPPWPVPPK